ncbi:MAG: hypothetical protein QM793_04470 [Muricomes sp.]
MGAMLEFYLALCLSEMQRSGIELMAELGGSPCEFQQCTQKKACFRMGAMLEFYLALCLSEMQHRGIELMAELGPPHANFNSVPRRKLAFAWVQCWNFIWRSA